MDAKGGLAYKTFRFTHIPKCGGTSFRALINDSALSSGIALESIYIPGFNGVPNDKNISQLTLDELSILKSKSITVFAGHMRHNEYDRFNIPLIAPFNITVLRNPVNRFISHYNFFNYKLGYNNCKGIHLNELEAKSRREIIRNLSNIQCHYLGDIKNYRKAGNDVLLELAKNNLANDYQIVGILEQIDRCTKSLKELSPSWITFDKDLPTHNKGDDIDEIENEIIEQITETNYLDMELYKFGEKLIFGKK